MWNKTLSCCAILGSLSARARAALPLAPSRCETPQNRTASASFVFGRRNKIPRSKLTRYFIFENRRFSTLASLAALLHGEPDAGPRPPPPFAHSPPKQSFGELCAKIGENRGFTLIEMMVATALFAIVMLVSVSTLLALADANRKAQALQSVINNLNVSLDGMVRAIRIGSDYHCGSTGVLRDPQSCPTGGDTYFAFQPYHEGDAAVQPWVYKFDGTQILKSETGGEPFYAITTPEVQIDSVRFYVVGTARGADRIQPKVVITIKGTASAGNERAKTEFNIQATAVQRILDI
ncbi:MAG: hypothetical protein UY63_C0004G0026 [Parcubacteria group bacterium GW2011_GWA2_51_10]|nr:MAG: hypothetical protein UY63_C0004G0026 [Parcubacteria group bacterium GW2011_GWA2_51_10]